MLSTKNAAVADCNAVRMLAESINRDHFFKSFVVTSSECWIWEDEGLQISIPLPTSDNTAYWPALGHLLEPFPFIGPLLS